ncbi:MAG TPA: 16S rRNA (adenine(1518)-N(6)/adenine(1519)-N(6))-dimethyltransferase RsmA [Bryobacteraceae bacterium]|nr:16S rRNA (adenine(1518)-N(6)/adenine(1519)-N(6))-dimethyltransferase RsmA [Bryobacteraceae bacterium]
MARQKLGQHFLVRAAVLERIARAACPAREPLVVEIGPGRGALTTHLLARADRVVAVEIDPYLVQNLGQKVRQASSPDVNLEVVEANALQIDLAQWGPATITGNLPYYAATAILERVMALGPIVRRGVFLTQKEVAQRITASPGSRDYGYLSVAMQLSADIEFLFEVPPAAFHPPPKVDSAVLRFVPHDCAAELGIEDRAAFLRFVALCFHQKRKTLRNNLSAQYGSAVDGWPEVNLRAEQIGIPIFAAMYHRLVT